MKRKESFYTTFNSTFHSTNNGDGFPNNGRYNGDYLAFETD